ncbi:hypothetical protein PVAP13_3NG073460 [Panicum virgatum]|uniref:Uncharacterized protein n=1 Tax=Panicum virgatum TaxID=38727 RepID=A0A8T0TYP4_PANVG|nr:hypothetical protein PVAP13_3NG073460 [Panicum virgatum]
MMNKAPPSLLVLCLTILAAVLIIVLTMHVEPAQAGSRQPMSTPPSPQGHPGPRSHCCK